LGYGFVFNLCGARETSNRCGVIPFSEETLATNIRCFFVLQMHLEILWNSFTNEQKCNSLCSKASWRSMGSIDQKRKIKISKRKLTQLHFKRLTHKWVPILYINSFVCSSVCRGLETQITFKIVPPNSRAHFYFFTYRVPNPESQQIQVPSPNTQASNYLLGCLRSKSRTVKKNLARAGRRPTIDHVINK